MIARATAKIRITNTPEIIRTVEIYTHALQHSITIAWEKKIKNNFKLHPLVYQHLRSLGLPSQLAIACVKQACGMVKRAKSKPLVRKTSIRYNFPRSANLKGQTLILRTITKREEFILNIPKCYKEYFTWDLNESLLRIDKRGRAFFLFCFSKEIPCQERIPSKVLGIDLGIHNLAVTSDNHFFCSYRIKQIKRKFFSLRCKLQAKGTRAAKYLLRRISGRETRFMAWVNHNVSKQIVSLFSGGDKIVMEDLKGIRKTKRGKRWNYWISNWSYFQLQGFIRYKAERRGITVENVKAHYSSQLCHRCGTLGARSRGSFSCVHCGLSRYNADLNAARNLAHPMLVERQAAVNQPYLTCDEAKASVCG